MKAEATLLQQMAALKQRILLLFYFSIIFKSYKSRFYVKFQIFKCWQLIKKINNTLWDELT